MQFFQDDLGDYYAINPTHIKSIFWHNYNKFMYTCDVSIEFIDGSQKKLISDIQDDDKFEYMKSFVESIGTIVWANVSQNT